MFYPAFVHLSVCFSNFTKEHKKYWSDLHKTFTRNVAVDKEELMDEILEVSRVWNRI